MLGSVMLADLKVIASKVEEAAFSNQAPPDGLV